MFLPETLCETDAIFLDICQIFHRFKKWKEVTDRYFVYFDVKK